MTTTAVFSGRNGRTVSNGADHPSIAEEGTLGAFMRRYASHPKLPEEETRKLIAMFQAGDAKALDRLTRHYFRLIIKMAWKYADRGVPLMDLIHEGYRGFVMALEKYDLVGFQTPLHHHAKLWILHPIRRAYKKQAGAINKAVAVSFDEEDRETGLTLYDFTASWKTLSPAGYAIARDEVTEFDRQLPLLIEAVERLTVEDWFKTAFYAYYGINGHWVSKTTAAIAKEAKVSKSRVKFIVKKRIWELISWNKNLPSRHDFEERLKSLPLLREKALQ